MNDNSLPQSVPGRNHPGADLTALTDVAFQLADAASEQTLKYFRLPIGVDNKLGLTESGDSKGFDPVTVADREAEAAMRDILAKQCPDDGIIGEEFGNKPGCSGRNWILDPLDGTRAFITGMPLWGTLIGVQVEQTPVFGLVDQPFLGERYYSQTKSAYRRYQGQAAEVLSVRACSGLSDAVMLTTSPDMFSNTERVVFERLRSSVKLARFGGDCYAYCMLASGFCDLVVESDLQAYDIQPLIPIIEGAGGIVTDWSGEPLIAGGQVLAAADPGVHAAALAVLHSAAVSTDISAV